MYTQILGSKVVDYQDESPASDVLIPLSGAETQVLSFRLKPGRRPYIVFCGQAWDPAGDRQVSWCLEVNNRKLFDWTTIQKAPPEQADRMLPKWEPVEQLSLVRVLMKNADTGNDYYGTGRVVVYYLEQGAPQV